MVHPWHDLSAGSKPPEKINVVVEIPKGSRNKYELDKESGLFCLSRTLYSPMIYPGDYGLIPQTYYEDHDPLDALILINEPTFVGCVVEVRPVGIFRMLDKGEPDDKVLCVPCGNPYFGNVFNLQDVAPHFLMEVAHFFAVYKDLEGSRTLSLGWEPVETAHRQIRHAMDLYAKNKHDIDHRLKNAAPKLLEAAPMAGNGREALVEAPVRKSATAKKKG